MRLATVLLGAALTACSTSAPMVRMEPVPAKDHDVQFKNGRPIVFSRGERFDVAVSPKGGPTGRYKLEPRLELMVGIRNRSGQRIEVSEQNISATGNRKPTRVVGAVEIEDAIINNASWAQAMNAFARGMQYAAARNAGRTTFSGTASQTATLHRTGQLGETEIHGQTEFVGHSYNQGAVMEAQRQAEADTAAKAHAIQAQARADLDQVATAFQRNTIEPHETYMGAVLIEPPRSTACGVLVRAEETYEISGRPGVFDAKPAVIDPGPCNIRLSVNIEGEIHTFDFNEVLSK